VLAIPRFWVSLVAPLGELQARSRQVGGPEENRVNETVVTIVGNVASAIGTSRLPDGTTRATFRVGSSERRFDRATGRWVDGDRLYVSVTCWRRLAENTVASLVKGDPVVVRGRLYTRNYEQDGNRRSVVQMDAHAVAADLSHCTAVLTRARPGQPAAGDGDAAAMPEPAAEPHPATGAGLSVAVLAGPEEAATPGAAEEPLASSVPAHRL
jgi:single-strand DNA-binding protein